jgi:hypothetical protein
MTDEPMEGNLASGESNANSNSSQSTGQPLEANLADTIAKLQRKVDAQEGEIRALKGGKDKAVDRAIKSQEQTLATIAKYLNVDEAQVREAQRQSILDDLVTERLGGSQSAAPIPGRVGAQDESADARRVDNFTSADAIAEVESFELSANDPSFIDLLRKNPSKQQVKDYILEKKRPTKPASVADVVQPPVTGGSTPSDVGRLIAELNEWQKTPSKYREQIKQRVAELDKRGWK